MTHEIKLMLDFCDAVMEGRKTFEVRQNDRGYQTGDYVKFIPVMKDGEAVRETAHPVMKRTYRITYVLNGWGLKDGYVAFAIAEDAPKSILDEPIESLNLCTQAYNSLKRGTLTRGKKPWNNDGECKTVRDVLAAYQQRRLRPIRLMGPTSWANVAEALKSAGVLDE